MSTETHDQRLHFLSPPSFDTPGEERTYRKSELAIAYRLFGSLGLMDGATGHISVRDPENPDRFWLGPFGKTFERVCASDLQLFNSSGDLLSGAGPVNPAGYVIHAQLYAARPDVHAAAHTHSLYGKAFSSLGIELAPMTEEACAFFEDHAIHPYGGVPDHPDEAKRIAESLGSRKALILSNHGLLTVGASVAEAAWWYVSMEACCRAQLLAMAAGTLVAIERDAALATASKFGSQRMGWFQIQPQWQEIARRDPSVFD